MSALAEQAYTLRAPYTLFRDASRVRDAAGLLALILGVLSITELPYLFAYSSTPAGQQFMGILLNVADSAQYRSWAHEFTHSLLIGDKLTSEQGPAVYFNLFWFVVGRLSSSLDIGLADATQLVRPFAGATYLIAIAWFCSLIFPGDRLRWWVSTLVASLGGGLGWLLVVQKQLSRSSDLPFPLDLYVTEPNTFLSIMAFPHQAMAGGILVGLLGLIALAFERNSLKLANGAGILGLALGLQHAYDLVVVLGVTGSVAVIRAVCGPNSLRPLVLAVAACVWSVPVGLYSVYITRTSEVWRGTLAQYGNAGVYTPSPPHLLILMGLPLILTIAVVVPRFRGARLSRIRTWVRSTSATEQLLFAWLLVGFCLLYVPTDFQIKMLVGWQVPVSIFATRALFAITRRSTTAWLPSLAVCVFVAAAVPTNVYLLAWRFVDLARHDYPYYLHQDELEALHWLEANSAPTDVVLSSLTIGQYLPSVSGNHAFLGHWAATLDFYSKRNMVESFFDNRNPDDLRSAILAKYHVRFVFYGPAERMLEGGYDPARAPYLKPVHANPVVAVYAVEPSVRKPT